MVYSRSKFCYWYLRSLVYGYWQSGVLQAIVQPMGQIEFDKLRSIFRNERSFAGERPSEEITWTPDSGMWLEKYFYYRMDIPNSPWASSSFNIKELMQKDESTWGIYREEWIYHSSDKTDSWYFNDLEKAKLFWESSKETFPKRANPQLTTYIRGPKDEILDIDTFEEITMSYPYSVEISDEHDGEDIQDWLLENGWGHQMDWKALRMRHKGVYSIHFRQAHMAMLTKLRWGGQ